MPFLYQKSHLIIAKNEQGSLCCQLSHVFIWVSWIIKMAKEVTLVWIYTVVSVSFKEVVVLLALKEVVLVTFLRPSLNQQFLTTVESPTFPFDESC